MVAAWSLTGAHTAIAQQASELGVEAIATLSDPALVIAGPYAALRTSDRTRISALAGAGLSDGDLAWRGEALGYFLLSPTKRHGWSTYLAGGLAAVGGSVDRGYLVLLLGIEERPGASSGWAAELGVGGGFRAALGYRWRRFSREWAQ